MRAGQLRHRVTIQTLTVSQDGYGEPTETWSNTATVWGEVRPLIAQTREALTQASGQRVARQTFNVRLRWREGIAPATTRVLWDDQVLDVEAVMDPDGRRRELDLICYLLR